MKYILCVVLLAGIVSARGQSIVGTWQEVDKKTCFEGELPLSETEKELLPKMQESSSSGVARLLKFDAKNHGEEGIFSDGKKKGTDLDGFQYRINGNELQFLDKKSGIMTRQFIIDELSESTLRIHDAKQECEVRVFSKVK